MVPGAGGQGGELGIGLEVGAAHAVAQRVPGAGGDGADDHGHGLAGVDAVGGHIGVVVAGAVLDVALLVVILQGVVDVDKVAHEGEIDELALAGPLLVEEGYHNGGEEALGAYHVADDGAYAGGVAVALTGLGVQAGHGHGADVIGGLVAVLGGLVAEGGERAVDYAGVHLLHVLVAEAELLQEAGLVGGQDDVGVLYGLEQQLLGLGVAELYFKGLLAAVLAAGVGGDAVDVEGELPAALAAGDLYLDDVGAVVCEVGADLRAGGVGGEVKDLDAFEHFHSVFSFLICKI